jgi:PAS domain S-box-containing protein
MDDIVIRSFIISIALSFTGFLASVVLFQNQIKSIRVTTRFIAFIFLVHGAIFAIRAFLILAGSPMEEVFRSTLVSLLAYFDALIVGLAWTFGFLVMVNQRLNAEKSESSERFISIFNTSPDAVAISSLSDGNIYECNSAFLSMSGYLKEEIIGKTSLGINIWHDSTDRDRIVTLLKGSGFVDNFEAEFQRKDGSTFTGLMSARVINLDGNASIISVTRDITERKEAEQEIKCKNEQLYSANAEKDKLFSIIAHDLRSPFSSLLGFTQLLDEELPVLTQNEVQKMVRGMRKSTIDLYNLLENLLEWSMMQRDLISFNPELLPLRQEIMDTIGVLKESANKKKIEISDDIPADLEVIADKAMLDSILRNLISNSIKFTNENGQVSIMAESMPDLSVKVSISDTGIGISKAMLKNLFRIDVNTSRKGTNNEASSGLGLMICKDFVEKHGGNFWVESEEGKGSTFSFILPKNN